MSAPALPYAGPVECLTLDEAAVRCRTTRETFERIYTGKRVHIGRNVVIYAKHLDAWLDEQAGLKAESGRTGPVVEVA